MSKISICITYYNQEEFVRQSIDSVLAIDFPCDYEILCGDDGSSDGTLDIIKEYAKKYPDNIKYFVMDRLETEKSINRASLNRLNLASKAEGDYIMFLDGDDFYCDKDFLKEAVQVLENNQKLEACCFSYKYLYEDNSEESVYKNISEGIIESSFYIKNAFYIVAEAFVFRNILDKNKLDLLYKINNFDDNGITLYMLQFGDLYFIKRPICMYRQVSNSLWNSACECEKHILNALDYKLILDSAPRLKKEIAMRQYEPIKYLYRNKKLLKEQLGEKYDKYLLIAKNNNDKFIESLLLWNELNLVKKILTFLFWKYYKNIVKV